MFSHAGGVAANRIARWDGSSWSALGSGLGSSSVIALAVFDDGGGPELYAGGGFTTAGGIAASRVARWDGASWSALGGGLNNAVYALAVFDDGTGPALYAAGYFDHGGGMRRVARWDGASWTALGTGMDALVEALGRFDDGSGPALYAGGLFTTAGGVVSNGIARWDGASWSALGSGLPTGSVRALAAFDDGQGAALYAGGAFFTGASRESYLTRWGCPRRVRTKDW